MRVSKKIVNQSRFYVSMRTLVLVFSLLLPIQTMAQDAATMPMLDDIKNYQVNSPTMVSAGLPSDKQFEALKSAGITKVIDLIPGDRSTERSLMQSFDLSYYNVQVEWEDPSLQNFIDYVAYMNSSKGNEGITLTHCRLNWRGAVFTYLYKVTQLNEDEAKAKKDMLAIWQPNEIWQDYIDEVIAFYQPK